MIINDHLERINLQVRAIFFHIRIDWRESEVNERTVSNRRITSQRRSLPENQLIKQQRFACWLFFFLLWFYVFVAYHKVITIVGRMWVTYDNSDCDPDRHIGAVVQWKLVSAKADCPNQIPHHSRHSAVQSSLPGYERSQLRSPRPTRSKTKNILQQVELKVWVCSLYVPPRHNTVNCCALV